MTTYCYALEAHSIQRFIARGGKLRDMVAASDMLDALCRQPLDDLLRAAEIGDEIHFSRRAGGAWRAFCDSPDVLERLRDLVSLTVPQYAPALPFTHAIGQGDNAIEASRDTSTRLRALRNQPLPQLPAAGPLTLRCPRTGDAAVSGRGEEARDADLRRKRQWAAQNRNGLAQRILPDAPELEWPLQIDAQDLHQPSLLDADSGGVAVVHADGNGLGQMLIGLTSWLGTQPNLDTRSYAKALFGFSQALEAATLAAAQESSRLVLLPAARARRNVVPARPLVLGGDDLTFIIRDDLALPFARCFLSTFETAIASELESWLKQLPSDAAARVPNALSAAAGIAWVKPRMPYFQAHELAEKLCQQAKMAAAPATPADRMKPSTLAFARVTSSLIGEPDDLVGFARTTPGTPRIRMGFPAYALVDDCAELPALSRLLDLSAHLQRLPNAKPLRSLLNLMQSDMDAARDSHRRWREVLAKDDNGEGSGRRWLRAWDEKLAALGSHVVEGDLPWFRNGSDTAASPLGDLVTLMGLSADMPGGAKNA